MAPVSSVVAAWDLGLRLREKRELLGLLGKDVQAKTRIATSYLSAVERGKQQLSEDKLTEVAKPLEFNKAGIAELIRLRAQALDRGWWTKFSALVPEDVLRLFGFECGAESIRTYSSDVVYGMLQTERYARDYRSWRPERPARRDRSPGRGTNCSTDPTGCAGSSPASRRDERGRAAPADRRARGAARATPPPVQVDHQLLGHHRHPDRAVHRHRPQRHGAARTSTSSPSPAAPCLHWCGSRP